MVFGVFSQKAWFPVIPITFLLAGLQIEMDQIHAQPPEARPAKAQDAEVEQPQKQELSGFALLEAYDQKVSLLEKFKVDHALRDTDLRQRKSRAADEVNRVIEGIKLLMEQEAQRMFDEAMKSDDPMIRDGILKQLRDSKLQIPNTRRRAEAELLRRTEDGAIYPTVEEARKKARELEEEKKKKLEAVDQIDLDELEQKKREHELMTSPITKAAAAYAEKDAHAMFERAVRLVFPQRRALLEEVLRKHPNTQAAAMATEMLALLQMRNEHIANHKLHKALNSPLGFDQRWRRLKEIELYHPATGAASEANRISEEHLSHVPPMGIANRTDRKVELTVDVPYSKLQEITLEPGQSQNVPSAFPVMIRVHVGSNQWTIYNAFPAMHYDLQTTNGVPVLYLSP